MSKKIADGLTFHLPLQFGDWPVEKIQEIIKNTEAEYNLNDFRLDYVSRGGYQKCQDPYHQEPCEDLVETFGQITWKRVE